MEEDFDGEVEDVPGKEEEGDSEGEDSEGTSACMLDSMLIFYPWCVFVV